MVSDRRSRHGRTCAPTKSKTSTQLCLFGVKNQIYFDASISRRTTQEDVADEVGVSAGTVDRCLKGFGNLFTIDSVKQAAERLGYKRVDKWASIKQEFIQGQDSEGRPIIDEQSVFILRERGKSVRNISKISGICIKQINKILTNKGMTLHNLQTIKDSNGLSKAQNIELKSLKIKRHNSNLDAQFNVRGSWARKTTANILRQYKSGIPIQRAARNISVDRSTAWRCVAKTRAYKLLASKRVKMFERTGPSVTCTFSSKYYNEKSMLCAVEERLKENFSKELISREANVVGTFYGKCVRHLRADFVIKQDNTKPLAIEVKVCTDSKSIKMLMGQITIYKTCGYDVQCVFPDDVFVSEFAQSMLSRNNVTYWTV